ncbi:conserved protein, unknown function, partial [Hepatocystis sp. ex Piliocolobus tephrosceles]
MKSLNCWEKRFLFFTIINIVQQFGQISKCRRFYEMAIKVVIIILLKEYIYDVESSYVNMKTGFDVENKYRDEDVNDSICKNCIFAVLLAKRFSKSDVKNVVYNRSSPYEGISGTICANKNDDTIGFKSKFITEKLGVCNSSSNTNTNTDKEQHNVKHTTNKNETDNMHECMYQKLHIHTTSIKSIYDKKHYSFVFSLNENKCSRLYTIPKTSSYTIHKTNSDTIPKTNSDTIPKTNSKTIHKTNSDTIPKTNSKTIPKTNSKTIHKTNSDTIPKTNSKAIPKTNSKTIHKTNSDTIPKTNSDTIPKTNSKTIPKTNSKTIPKTNSDTIPSTSSDSNTSAKYTNYCFFYYDVYTSTNHEKHNPSCIYNDRLIKNTNEIIYTLKVLLEDINNNID